MKWDNVLLLPLAGFVIWPLAALVPSGAFAAAWAWRRRASSLFAALAWGAYAIYESLMKARVLCSGECNIRVDLLLIMPALWIVAVVAVVHVFRARHA